MGVRYVFLLLAFGFCNNLPAFRKLCKLNDPLMYTVPEDSITIISHPSQAGILKAGASGRFFRYEITVFRHTPNLRAMALFEAFSSSIALISAS